MSNKVQGLHHLAINVADFDKALHFYGEVLGLSKTAAWGGEKSRAIMYDTGNGSCIELFEKPDYSAADNGRIIHLAFKVENCDVMHQAAVEAGAVSTVEPKEVDISGSPGFRARISFVEGVNGEIIEFFQVKN